MSVQRKVDTVVHIGAGRCGEFEEYKDSGSRRIVLIESEPESARYLREMLSEMDYVQIFEKAISSSDEPHELYIFNVRGFSSLRKPMGLWELFPGLRKTGELYPDMWSVRRMCEELDIEENKCNWLIVDAPGEEQAILESLRDEGLLERFEWVSFYAGLSPLYEGNCPAEEISEILGDQCYETISREDKVEPERPRWTLYRDEVKVRNKELEKRVDQLRIEIDVRSNEINKLKIEIDTERNAHKEVKEEKDKLKNIYNKKMKSLQDYISRVIQKLYDKTNKIDRLEKTIKELNNDYNIILQKHKYKERECKENENKLYTLTKDIEVSQKRIEKMKRHQEKQTNTIKVLSTIYKKNRSKKRKNM